jgi:hypothetical protein
LPSMLLVAAILAALICLVALDGPTGTGDS